MRPVKSIEVTEEKLLFDVVKEYCEMRMTTVNNLLEGARVIKCKFTKEQFEYYLKRRREAKSMSLPGASREPFKALAEEIYRWLTWQKPQSL